MKHTSSAQLFKNIRFKILLAFIIFPVWIVKAQTIQPDKVHVGFIYPLSTNGTHAPADTNSFSMHVLAGVSAQENGLAFAGLTNVVRNDLNGLGFAGFSNHIFKKANGLLFAGFMNTYGSAKGFQFAGFSNVASKDVEGAQFAGFSNIAQNVNGSQFAGFVNVAKNSKGSQFAGFGNVTNKHVGGSQFAGFINVADTVKGFQFAGFINIAKKVKGGQFAGFINIADSSDCPVGLINLIKNGEKSIAVTVDENQTSLISFRSGGKILYGILGLGYNFKNSDAIYAFEAGLGAHFFNTEPFRLNAELAATYLEGFGYGEYLKSSIRFLPAITLGKRLEIFAGPSFNFITTNTLEGEMLNKHYLTKRQNRYSDYFQAVYIGYTGGLNIKF
ncbi:MAG: hypothetical protein H7Y07_11905 [Pyrinomonadaceae bacterium]|nr:hypothetical protein [Sphingobacteriaceae bacterium]